MKSGLPILLIIAASCSAPTEFPRDNPVDPTGDAFEIPDLGGLTSTRVDRHIKLTWTESFDRHRIFIERSLDGGPFVLADSLESGVKTWADTTVAFPDSIVYQYRVFGRYLDNHTDTLMSYRITSHIHIAPIQSATVSGDQLILSTWATPSLTTDIVNDLQTFYFNRDSTAVSVEYEDGSRQFLQRIGQASFKYLKDIIPLRYVITQHSGGKVISEWTTPVLERFQSSSTSATIFFQQMGMHDGWTAFEMLNGLPHRVTTHRTSLTLWRLFVMRPDGQNANVLNIRPNPQIPFFIITSIRHALSATRFAFVENLNRLVYFPFTGNPLGTNQTLPNHQVWRDIAYNHDGSVLYASFSDTLEGQHDIRSFTHSNETWETIHTLERAAEWFAIDTVANRLHTIEILGAQQTWVTRQWSDGRILFSAPISGQVNQVVEMPSRYKLYSGQHPGDRFWIVDAETNHLEEVVFPDVHRFMVATSEPGVYLRAVGNLLYRYPPIPPGLDIWPFLLPSTTNHNLNITSADSSHIIAFQQNQSLRYSRVYHYRFIP